MIHLKMIEPGYTETSLYMDQSRNDAEKFLTNSYKVSCVYNKYPKSQLAGYLQ